MSASQDLSTGEIYEQILQCGSACSWPAPWDFLLGDQDCRGPIGDPAGALALLRSQFPDNQLKRARVIKRSDNGSVRLNPALCNSSAIVALRRSTEAKPFDLLVANGCLAGSGLPVMASLQDAQTTAGLAQNGILVAAANIQEVALLRALGLAATLVTGLVKLDAATLVELDKLFNAEGIGEICNGRNLALENQHRTQICASAAGNGAAKAAPPAMPSPATAVKQTNKRQPAALALLGWAPLSVSGAVSPVMAKITTHLVSARNQLDLNLDGINVWQPSREWLEDLRQRLRWKNAAVVHELLADMVVDLEDIDCLVDGHDSAHDISTSAPGNLIAAQAQLLEGLTDDRIDRRISDRVRNARRTYEGLVEQELIQPLQTWALANTDPVIRNAGMDLATICRLLHRLSPTLHELQARLSTDMLERSEGSRKGDVFKEYLQLSKRLGCLIKDLCHWRRLK